MIKTPHPISLNEAVKFILTVENDAGEHHLSRSLGLADENLAMLFNQLGRADCARCSALMQLMQDGEAHPSQTFAEGTLTAQPR